MITYMENNLRKLEKNIGILKPIVKKGFTFKQKQVRYMSNLVENSSREEKVLSISVENSYKIDQPAYKLERFMGYNVQPSTIYEGKTFVDEEDGTLASFDYVNWRPWQKGNSLDLNSWSNQVNENEFQNFLYYDFISVSAGAAIMFLLINFLFKLTASPFNIWAPSVYDQAPLLTSAFLSILSKIVILFFMVSLLGDGFLLLVNLWQPILIGSAVVTIFVSIVGAISEKVLKRFYVYSSMTHVAFMLLGLASGTLDGIVSTLNYLSVYVLGSLFMWIFLMYNSKNLTHLTNLRLVLNHSPILAFMFSIVMFSTAGIPPLGGFFVKFDILKALMYSQYYYIAFLVLLLSVITFFYYLRLVKIIYFSGEGKFIRVFELNSKQTFFLTYIFLYLVFYVFHNQYIDNYITMAEFDYVDNFFDN